MSKETIKIAMHAVSIIAHTKTTINSHASNISYIPMQALYCLKAKVYPLTHHSNTKFSELQVVTVLLAKNSDDCTSAFLTLNLF